ncbi:helix-turn-helix domain-containing protein [Candidatus Soleaferrea massiliensis]|uniref:helix-turn-helix domain-containing protein n=1 Tax=Candidatus Soleaferrea massiliensis TaxID=1470354 RepID=UPI000693B85E|nr:helix-turn-helix transcriptional regulator [Candidatus Soleaferrea massiliensis]
MEKEQLKAMAGRIKSRRAFLGFTQEKFAEIVEISFSSYTKIENAFQQPSLDTLIRISQNLYVSLDYIIFGTDVNEPINNEKSELLSALLDFSDQDKLSHASEVLDKLIRIKDQNYDSL